VYGCLDQTYCVGIGEVYAEGVKAPGDKGQTRIYFVLDVHRADINTGKATGATSGNSASTEHKVEANELRNS
jgi:hypothetical protein